jgi:hypothetical protein
VQVEESPPGAVADLATGMNQAAQPRGKRGYVGDAEVGADGPGGDGPGGMRLMAQIVQDRTVWITQRAGSSPAVVATAWPARSPPP